VVWYTDDVVKWNTKDPPRLTQLRVTQFEHCNIFEKRRIFSSRNESILRRTCRKNTAGWKQRRLGGRLGAGCCQIFWSLNFSWTPHSLLAFHFPHTHTHTHIFKYLYIPHYIYIYIYIGQYVYSNSTCTKFDLPRTVRIVIIVSVPVNNHMHVYVCTCASIYASRQYVVLCNQVRFFVAYIYAFISLCTYE
jgi:hypothetical protein